MVFQCQMGTVSQMGAGRGTRRASWMMGPRAARLPDRHEGFAGPHRIFIEFRHRIAALQPVGKLCGSSGSPPAGCRPLKSAMMLHRVLIALCLLLLASNAAADAPARRALLAARPRPRCQAATALITLPNKTKQRRPLPACAANTTVPAARPTAAAAVAAAPSPSSAYPCVVGDAACFCKWKGTLGYFADNDPAVACK